MPFLKELKEVALPVRQPEQCYTGRGRSAFIAPRLLPVSALTPHTVNRVLSQD